MARLDENFEGMKNFVKPSYSKARAVYRDLDFLAGS